MTSTTTELPAGRYTVDLDHSRIGFESPLFLGLKVNGTFERFESVVDVVDSPATSGLTLTVWTDSVRTGIAKRDEHLRAANVLDVGAHPTMAFRTTSVSKTSDGYDVEGVLQVRGTSRPVAFRAAAGAEPARFTARLPLTPADFGVTRRGTTKPLTVVLDITLKPEPPTT